MRPLIIALLLAEILALAGMMVLAGCSKDCPDPKYWKGDLLIHKNGADVFILREPRCGTASGEQKYLARFPSGDARYITESEITTKK